MYNQNLLIGTIAFVVLGVIAYLIASFKISRTTANKDHRAQHLSIARGVCAMGAFCMWSHWICCHMHQMNPIIQAIPGGH